MKIDKTETFGKEGEPDKKSTIKSDKNFLKFIAEKKAAEAEEKAEPKEYFGKTNDNKDDGKKKEEADKKKVTPPEEQK